LLLDWCFFSLPGHGRSEGQKLPSHNVMFRVIRQSVIARRDFLGSGCVAIHSERSGMHLFSVTTNIHCSRSPEFTVIKNFFESIRASAHKKSLHCKSIPKVHRYLSFTTRRINSFAFGFPRTRFPPPATSLSYRKCSDLDFF